MKRQIIKILTYVIIIFALIILGGIFSSHIILYILWLQSQNVISSLLALLFIRWLSIPTFAFFVSLLSVFHLISASKKEFINKKFFLFKTFSLFIIAFILEYHLKIVPGLLAFLLGGNSGFIDPLTKSDMSLFFFSIPLAKKLAVFVIFYCSSLLGFRLLYPNKNKSIHIFDRFLILLVIFSGMLLMFITKWELIQTSAKEYIGFMDIYGNILPFLVSLLIVFIACILFIFFNFKKGIFFRNTLIFLGLTIFILQGILPIFLEKFIYKPNQSSFQEKFAGIHAESTRIAFGLDKILRTKDYLIQEKDLPQILSNNFWQDPAHFLKLAQRNQEILPIFRIHTANPILLSNDNGEFSPYIITVRESSEESHDLWDIKHFRNIFGYGAIVGTANKFSPEGFSELVLKDLELNTNTISLPIKNPHIFFSDSYDDYAFINTKMLIPNFEKDQFPLESLQFEGISSIPVNWFTRTILAIRYGDSRFFLTDYFRSDTSFLFKRKPSDIAKTLLPLFHYSSPKITYHNQELWWEMDAYTVSENVYPSTSIATPWGKYNWVQSPMKVYVSAYSGEIIFDILEPNNPFIKLITKLYPALFQKTINIQKEKYNYPEILFAIQSKLLETFHDTNAASFYSRLNQREISSDTKDTSHTNNIQHLMLLHKNQLALQQTYNPKGKNIFASQFLAYIDSNKQKKLILYEAPANLGIPGQNQALSFLNQDPEFSRLSTLWGQIGSELSRSQAIFYPMEDRGLYANTIFLESETLSTPIAAQFSIVNNTTINLGNSINQVIYNTLKNLDKSGTNLANKEQLKDIITEMYNYYLQAEQARISDNTQEYKENVDKIGVLLQKIQTIAE